MNDQVARTSTHNKEAGMTPAFVRCTLRVGLGSVLLFALQLFPFAVTISPVVQAVEKSDLLDINTATDEQL